MSAEIFHEFDAFLSFLPEFHVSVDTRGHYEVGFGANDVRDDIPMHVALLIALSIRQIVQIEFLELQN